MHYKTLLLCLLTMVVSSIGAQTQTKQFRVNFNVDEHTLDKTDEATLTELLLYCKQASYAEVKLTAHTDIDANEQYNLALSKRRALSVTTYLKTNLINTNNITVNWYGEKKPETSNKTEEGKAINRRVDIEITTYQINNTNDLLNAVSPNYAQIFNINPNKDNTIIGKNGTTITIPKGALIAKNGKAVDANIVEITLKEYLKPVDALFNQLSTISDGKLLESGGMFSITATANGEELNLKQGQTMQVQMPSINGQNNMRLFTEVKNAQGISEWKPTNVPFKLVSKSPGRSFRDVSLDTDMLNKYIVPNTKPAFPQFEFTLPKNQFARPAPIGKAPKYIEPTLNTEFSKKERIFYSAKRLQTELDKSIAKYRDTYNHAMARYLRKKSAYESALAQFIADSTQFSNTYEEQVKSWLAQQKQLHEQYLVYLDRANWNDALQYLISLSNDKSVNEPSFRYYFFERVSRVRTNTGNRHIHSFALGEIALYEKMGLYEILNYCKKTGKIRLALSSRSTGEIMKVPNTFVEQLLEKDTVFMPMINEAFKELKLKQMSSTIEKEKSGNAVYSTVLNTLGTFNCDRFSQTPPGQMVRVTVPYENLANVSFYMPSLNSYLIPYREKNEYYAKVPKGAHIKIVLVHFEKDKGPILDVKVAQPEEDTRFEMNPTPVTIAELFKQLTSAL